MASETAEEVTDSIDFNQLVLGQCLGKVFGLDSVGNGTAVVNLAQDSKGKHVVVKRFFVDDASEEAIKLIRHEVVSMRQLKHDHILDCLSSFASPNQMEIWLVSPLMAMGSLRNVLDTHFPEGIPETAASPIIRDVLLGLVHLHERGIVHRALKAAHILIDKDGRAKLCGLRYSCSLYESVIEASTSASVGCLTQDRYDYPLYVSLKHLNWMSPEILQQNLLGYNEKSDIYSLGVTVCEMANGIIPFSDMPSTYMLLEKMRGAAPKLLDSKTVNSSILDPSHHPSGSAEAQAGQELVFSGQKPADSGVGASVGSCSNLQNKAFKTYSERTFSEQFHDFVQQCCLKDADMRQSAAQLLNHAFIKQVKKTAVSGGITTLPSLVPANDLIGATKVTTIDDEESLTMALSSQMIIDQVEWDF